MRHLVISIITIFSLFTMACEEKNTMTGQLVPFGPIFAGSTSGLAIDSDGKNLELAGDDQTMFELSQVLGSTIEINGQIKIITADIERGDYEAFVVSSYEIMSADSKLIELEGVLAAILAIGGETSGIGLAIGDSALVEVNSKDEKVKALLQDNFEKQVILHGEYEQVLGIARPIRNVFMVTEVEVILEDVDNQPLTEITGTLGVAFFIGGEGEGFYLNAEPLSYELTFKYPELKNVFYYITEDAELSTKKLILNGMETTKEYLTRGIVDVFEVEDFFAEDSIEMMGVIQVSSEGQIAFVSDDGKSFAVDAPTSLMNEFSRHNNTKVIASGFLSGSSNFKILKYMIRF